MYILYNTYKIVFSTSLKMTQHGLKNVFRLDK